jgi:hypothetical protein
MVKIIYIILFSTSIISTSFSQIIDIDYNKFRRGFITDSVVQQDNLQILKNGFVDFLTDGSIQASARLLRINIGEKNKFYLPLFIYTGASGNAFGSDKLNQTTVSNLLNPIGGIINLSFNGLQNIIKAEGITKLKLAYQLGGRLINGKDSITKERFNFFNTLANLGLFFQTGAWTPDNPSNMGVFYAQVKISTSFSSEENLKNIFGKSALDKNYFIGYSLDTGIEINQTINVKLGVYKYTNNQGISLLKDPVFKFSLDYSLK